MNFWSHDGIGTHHMMPYALSKETLHSVHEDNQNGKQHDFFVSDAIAIAISIT